MKTQITKIRDEIEDIRKVTNEIQKLIREDYENLYSNKLKIKMK
jgi:hypothetical protein